MTLVDFDTEVRVGRYSQADFPRLVERYPAQPDGRGHGGSTTPWASISTAAFAQDGRKVLLLYTDGADTRQPDQPVRRASTS